jgi:hypothetical protein
MEVVSATIILALGGGWIMGMVRPPPKLALGVALGQNGDGHPPHVAQIIIIIFFEKKA